MIEVLLVVAAAASPTTTYRINPARAEAGFSLKATMHTVHGTTKLVTGEVTTVAGEGGALSLSGRIEVNAASLDTDNASRDKTLHGTTLEVGRFPAIVLVPERFVPDGPAAVDGSRAGKIVGTLTIRDVSKPVTIAARLTSQGTRLVAEGTFEVPWGEFGVPDPSFGFIRIAKVAYAHFKAEFAPLGP